MADTVKAVGIGPGLDRFLSVVPHQPYAIAVDLFAAQLVGKFKKQRAGRSPVIGANIGSIAERIVCVVVTGDYDDAIFRPGKLGDDVVDGKLALDRQSV